MSAWCDQGYCARFGVLYVDEHINFSYVVYAFARLSK